MCKKFLTLLILLAMSGVYQLTANPIDTVVVDVNVDVKHIVGGISSFDRAKFVTIHADTPENEWESGTNEISDFRDDFLNGYDVYLGRNTGGITWYLNAQVTEDPNRPGFADSTSVKQIGQNVKNSYASKTHIHSYEYRNEQIICAQLHPFWPDGQETQQGWSLSQTDTEDEPFGTATGEYMGRYIRDSYGNGGATGQNPPKFVEVVNEPMYHLVTHGSTPPEKIFRFHNSVAKEIKKLNPDIQVGGFCAAFPDPELDNFQRWEERWKLFMDMSGENMDFWSIHMYDFPAFGGLQRYRKGAQMEATLDMMEHYSYLKLGVAKPFLISEFGAQTHDYSSTWSPYRDWLHMTSVNSMMLQFMERPNLVSKLINYIMLKAEWGYNASTGQAWGRRLMRKKNEPASYSGEWVYTDMVKMFQLWADVNGVRVDSKANNVDVLIDSYVDGNKVYVIANNLSLQHSRDIKVNLLGSANTIQSLKIRQLQLIGNTSEMTETIVSEIPETIEIGPEATMVLEYTYSGDIQINETSNEVKYYATEYYKSIAANQTLSFNINDVGKGQNGEAVLRLGIGRDKGKEIYPEVTFNGTNLNVVKNYRGGDSQEDRLSFFGVLEIDVPYDLVQANNTISVKFPDTGGFVSSVALQAFKFSKEINRQIGLITSVDKIQNTDLSIYPNPANDIITITSTGEMPERIDIYSMTGIKVLSKQLNAQIKELSICGLAEGAYLAKIKTNGRSYNRKLVVKNR